MSEQPKITALKSKKTGVDASFLNEEVANRALKFHKSFPQYEETPLRDLDNLAKKLGLKKFFVKDES